MRLNVRAVWSVLAVGGIVTGVNGCRDVLDPIVGTPTNLRYAVEPSGDPDRPAGLLLEWDPVLSDNLAVYNVYSRASTSGDWGLRASTTSTSFHDVGIPHLQYRVAAQALDGREGLPSDELTVDERQRLDPPNFLFTTSLDGAIHLSWGDNPFLNEPGGFKQYRVYSTSFDLDAGLCGAEWSREGTTIAPAFLAGALGNGVPRCFAVSAESIEGWESLWSEIRADTPRPDGRNVLIFPLSEEPTASGFRFFQDLNGDGQAGALELGVVAAGDRDDIDFWVFRDANDDLFLVPQRTGTRVAIFGDTPLEDLTDIDVAPEDGYSRSAVQAVPGWGYVWEMTGDGVFPRYGGLRVTHVGREYMIFDWSYQTDPGNPELVVQGDVSEGVVIRH